MGQVDNAIMVVIIVVLTRLAAMRARRPLIIRHRNLNVGHDILFDIMNPIQVRVE